MALAFKLSPLKFFEQQFCIFTSQRKKMDIAKFVASHEIWSPKKYEEGNYKDLNFVTVLNNISLFLESDPEFVKNLGKYGTEVLLPKLKKYSAFAPLSVACIPFTEILTPSIYFVVTLEEIPSYQEVLSEWEKIFNEHRKEFGEFSQLVKTRNSIRVWDDTCKAEIQLIPNLLHVGESSKEFVKRNDNSENSVYIINALYEPHAKFLAQQTPFVRKSLRLCTLWYRNMYLGPHEIPGLTILLDLIAVAAGIEAESDNIVNAIFRFLQGLENIDEMRLSFEKKEPNRWTTVGEDRSECVIGINHTPYRKNFPFETSKIFPPSNPHYNLTRILVSYENEVYTLKKFTAESIGRFMFVAQTDPINSYRFSFPFSPLPRDLYSHAFPEDGIKNPKIWLTLTVPSLNNHPKLEVRNFKNERSLEILHATKFWIYAGTSAIVSANAALGVKVNMKDLVKDVFDRIERDLGADVKIVEVKEEKNIADYDASFNIPLNGIVELNVKVSLGEENTVDKLAENMTKMFFQEEKKVRTIGFAFGTSRFAEPLE